jgi:hypothetical protein
MMRGAMVRPMSLHGVPLPLLALVLCLAGCTDWPDLGDPPGIAGAPDPRIAPLPDLPGPSPDATAALQEETLRLQARAAALRARGAAVGAAP